MFELVQQTLNEHRHKRKKDISMTNNANKLWNISACKTASGETTTYKSKYCQSLDTGAHVNVTDTPVVSLLWWGKLTLSPKCNWRRIKLKVNLTLFLTERSNSLIITLRSNSQSFRQGYNNDQEYLLSLLSCHHRI